MIIPPSGYWVFYAMLYVTLIPGCIWHYVVHQLLGASKGLIFVCSLVEWTCMNTCAHAHASFNCNNHIRPPKMWWWQKNLLQPWSQPFPNAGRLSWVVAWIIQQEWKSHLKLPLLMHCFLSEKTVKTNVSLVWHIQGCHGECIDCDTQEGGSGEMLGWGEGSTMDNGGPIPGAQALWTQHQPRGHSLSLQCRESSGPLGEHVLTRVSLCSSRGHCRSGTESSRVSMAAIHIPTWFSFLLITQKVALC